MANTNIYQGQIQGPFEANEELIWEYIRPLCKSTPKYILHLGIQTKARDISIDNGTLVEIINHGKEMRYEIGKTGIYEVGNTKITSIKFLEDQDNNTIIDFTVVL